MTKPADPKAPAFEFMTGEEIRRVHRNRWAIFRHIRRRIFGKVEPQNAHEAEAMDRYVWRTFVYEALMDERAVAEDPTRRHELIIAVKDLLLGADQLALSSSPAVSMPPAGELDNGRAVQEVHDPRQGTLPKTAFQDGHAPLGDALQKHQRRQERIATQQSMTAREKLQRAKELSLQQQEEAPTPAPPATAQPPSPSVDSAGGQKP